MKTAKTPARGPEPAEFELARQASRRLGRLLGKEPQVNLRCQTRDQLIRLEEFACPGV